MHITPQDSDISLAPGSPSHISDVLINSTGYPIYVSWNYTYNTVVVNNGQCSVKKVHFVIATVYLLMDSVRLLRNYPLDFGVIAYEGHHVDGQTQYMGNVV